MQDFSVALPDTSMGSSWPLLGPSPSIFSPTMDAGKLEEARMLLSGMDYNRAICQDEDGDTWVLTRLYISQKQESKYSCP